MKKLCIFYFFFCLSGCAAFKDAGVVYQTNFNFSAAQSYSLYERNSEVIEFQRIDDITRNSIEIALEKSMEKQGFSYTELTKADFIVSYHLISLQRSVSRQQSGERPQRSEQRKGSGNRPQREGNTQRSSGRSQGTDLSQYNRSVLYCDHCLRSSTWYSEEKNWSLSPGSLIIDLVDTKTKRSVWRSVYELDIDVEDNSRVTNDRIKKAISAMLAKYPSAKNLAN